MEIGARTRTKVSVTFFDLAGWSALDAAECWILIGIVMQVAAATLKFLYRMTERMRRLSSHVCLLSSLVSGAPPVLLYCTPNTTLLAFRYDYLRDTVGLSYTALAFALVKKHETCKL